MKRLTRLVFFCGLLASHSINAQLSVAVNAGFGVESYYKLGTGISTGIYIPSPLPLFKDKFYFGIRGNFHFGDNENIHIGNSSKELNTRVSYLGLEYGPTLVSTSYFKLMFIGIVGAALIEQDQINVANGQSDPIIRNRSGKLLLSPGLDLVFPFAKRVAFLVDIRYLRVSKYGSFAAYTKFELNF